MPNESTNGIPYISPVLLCCHAFLLFFWVGVGAIGRFSFRVVALVFQLTTGGFGGGRKGLEARHSHFVVTDTLFFDSLPPF